MRQFSVLLVLVGFASGVLAATNDPFEADLLDVRFHDASDIRVRNGEPRPTAPGKAVVDPATRSVLTTLRKEGATWRPLVRTVDEATVDRLQRRAAAGQRPGRKVRDLNDILRLRIPSTMSISNVIVQLEALPSVEKVHRVQRPPPPPAVPNYSSPTNSTGVWQRYLDAAVSGIDARYAWSNGWTGAGVKVCDIEYTYNKTHIDLPSITQVGGTPLPTAWGDHGTAVYGEMAGLNNGTGLVGIAHGASYYYSSPYTVQDGYDVASAIIGATAALSTGDVILIEQQTPGPVGEYVPVSWYEPTYDAIVIAVGAGITVVEAGGNGGQDLDDPIHSTGNGGHYPFLPGNDSGAIIVGAGQSPLGATPRSRLYFSSHGSTVDMQGYGGDVVTAGYGDHYSSEGSNKWYTASFSGTSSASPIVAGAAALISQVYKATHGVPPTPAMVRKILRDTGTPQQGADLIGPLPNVRAAILAITSTNDADGDTIIDLFDNCPVNANTDQADADGDGLGDVCDPCTPSQTEGQPSIAPGSPVVTSDPPGQNNVGDNVDLNTTPRPAGTLDQCGFGDFGRVYINHDATRLAIGAYGCDVAGNNNGMILFLDVNTLSDNRLNLWSQGGAPAGLDSLHNLAFSSGMDIAIVLGDEWGDGNYPSFNLGSGYNFGQGVFYLSSTSFTPVASAVLSQFDGSGTVATATADDDANQITDRWEVSLPWSSLGATGIASITSIKLCGVFASDGTSGTDRYLSANVLAASADCPAGVDPYGNYAFGFVTLEPWSVDFSDLDGDALPDAWELQHFATTTNPATSDVDGDMFTQWQEYVAGTGPADSNSFFRAMSVSNESGRVVSFLSVTGRLYHLQASDQPDSSWSAVPGQTNVPGVGGAQSLADPTVTNGRAYRVRVNLP